MRYPWRRPTLRNKYKWKGTGAAQDTETNVDDPASREVARNRGTSRKMLVLLRENINLPEELPSWIETPEQYEGESDSRESRSCWKRKPILLMTYEFIESV